MRSHHEEERYFMSKHSHTLTYYLQKFSDDQLMALIRSRMSEEDMEELFNLMGRLLKEYLNDEEYHTYFLKDEA
jgi:hypothetical protein